MRVGSSANSKFYRIMAGGAAAGVQGEKQRGNNTAPWRACAHSLCVQDNFPHLHALTQVRQEVCDPPADGVEYMEQRKLVQEQSREAGV